MPAMSLETSAKHFVSPTHSRLWATDDTEGREIQFKCPRSLEEAKATIAATLRRFVGEVCLHCDRTNDGDLVAPVFLESLVDRWEEVDASCSLASLFLPKIEDDAAWTMVPVDDRGGKVIALKPGPLRDLHDTIAAIYCTPVIPPRHHNQPMQFSGLTLTRLEAIAERLCPANAAPDTRGPCLLKMAVVTQRYVVNAATVQRAVKDGKLTDHRPVGHARNAGLILDECEVSRIWPSRKAPDSPTR